MSTEILAMISAFIIGIIFDYWKYGKSNKISKQGRFRKFLYKGVITYLLFKIGFAGGDAVVNQDFRTVIISGLIVMIAASFWTLFVLLLLDRWSSFREATRVSIAVHFGSVSVGTFIAGMTFLTSIGVYVDPTVAIWLALMEIPAILIGIWKLGIRLNTIVPILKGEWALAVLPISIFLGAFFAKSVPDSLEEFIFSFLFIPILLYFLFEMGRNASDNIKKLKGKLGSVFTVGILIPIIGGFFGTSLGYWLGYDEGSMFVLAILMASASYVLAPLCMQEFLRSVYKSKPKVATQVVAISMALSVGVTLPFNILIGFEIYHLMIQGMQSSPIFAVVGFGLPILIGVVSLFKKNRQTE